MKILQVLPYFSPRMGGPVQIVNNLSNKLVDRGNDVVLLTTDYYINENRILESKYDLVIMKNLFAKFNFYFSPGIIKWLSDNIKRFDVVHLHDFRTFQNLVTMNYYKKWGIPAVLTPHGSVPRVVQRKFLKRVYDFYFGKSILDSVKYLLAVSPVEIEQFREWGVDDVRICLIFNSFNLDEFSNLPSPGIFRRKFARINEKTKIVLYLGRLQIRKKVDLLINAFSLFHKKLENTALFIIGPDEGELGKLQKLVEQLNIQDCVYFIGGVYGEDKLSAYVDADLVVNPAELEIFGLVPFEALLCGTPVIVADDSGSGAIIREAGIGYITSQGAVDVLADTILNALENVEENQRMVEAGKNYIVENFELNKIVIQTERIYEEAIRSSI